MYRTLDVSDNDMYNVHVQCPHTLDIAVGHAFLVDLSTCMGLELQRSIHQIEVWYECKSQKALNYLLQRNAQYIVYYFLK